jgi:hypothetical protein
MNGFVVSKGVLFDTVRLHAISIKMTLYPGLYFRQETDNMVFEQGYIAPNCDLCPVSKSTPFETRFYRLTNADGRLFSNILRHKKEAVNTAVSFFRGIVAQ